MLNHTMTAEQTLLQEIEESKRWRVTQREESTYRRDLRKGIELINRVLENMKNLDILICALIESRMNELIDEINYLSDLLTKD
jgi:hypothetical protein